LKYVSLLEDQEFESLVAQAFQPVLTQAKTCGYQ